MPCGAPTVRQMNWAHTPPPVSFRSNLTSSFHLWLGLPSGILRAHLRFKVLILLFSSPIWVPCPDLPIHSHPIVKHRSLYVSLLVREKVRNHINTIKIIKLRTLLFTSSDNIRKIPYLVAAFTGFNMLVKTLILGILTVLTVTNSIFCQQSVLLFLKDRRPDVNLFTCTAPTEWFT